MSDAVEDERRHWFKLIVTLAACHRLPTVYPFCFFVTVGGLASGRHIFSTWVDTRVAVGLTLLSV